MKEIFYKKVGSRYKPVSEYDSDLLDSLSYGTHLLVVKRGSKSYRCNIDPAFAPVIAAAHYAGDAMASAIVEAGKLRTTGPLSPEDKVVWDTFLSNISTTVSRYLTYQSAYDISRAGIEAMENEAAKLLENPAVREAYDNFMLMAKLAYEEKQHET